jgi:hypothetical protein
MKYCDRIFFFIFNFLILAKFSTTPEYENTDENIEKSFFFGVKFQIVVKFLVANSNFLIKNHQNLLKNPNKYLKIVKFCTRLK